MAAPKSRIGTAIEACTHASAGYAAVLVALLAAMPLLGVHNMALKHYLVLAGVITAVGLLRRYAVIHVFERFSRRGKRRSASPRKPARQARY